MYLCKFGEIPLNDSKDFVGRRLRGHGIRAKKLSPTFSWGGGDIMLCLPILKLMGTSTAKYHLRLAKLAGKEPPPCSCAVKFAVLSFFLTCCLGWDYEFETIPGLSFNPTSRLTNL